MPKRQAAPAQADLSSARAELAAAHPEPALSRSPEHSEGEVEGPALSRSPERSEGEVEGPPESEPPAETAQPPEESREEPPPAPPDFRSLSAIDKIKLGLPARTPIKQRRG
ncbi:MAG: hypothetical protein ACE5JL_05590 [Dehalococcoidia bacterium]